MQSKGLVLSKKYIIWKNSFLAKDKLRGKITQDNLSRQKNYLIRRTAAISSANWGIWSCLRKNALQLIPASHNGCWTEDIATMGFQGFFLVNSLSTKNPPSFRRPNWVSVISASNNCDEIKAVACWTVDADTTSNHFSCNCSDNLQAKLLSSSTNNIFSVILWSNRIDIYYLYVFNHSSR